MLVQGGKKSTGMGRKSLKNELKKKKNRMVVRYDGEGNPIYLQRGRVKKKKKKKGGGGAY